VLTINDWKRLKNLLQILLSDIKAPVHSRGFFLACHLSLQKRRVNNVYTTALHQLPERGSLLY
jgi:hypothetical protein